MKTSSAKAKGRRAAQEAKDLIIKILSHSVHLNDKLEDDDIVVTSSGDTGEDLKLSPAARAIFPFNVEVKNQEKLNIWESYDQACTHGNHTPLLIFKRNHQEMLCAMKFEDLLYLMLRIK